MEISQHPPLGNVGTALTLGLKGRLDGAWSEHTQAALTRAIEAGFHQLVLDFSEVSFVSSAGVRVLIIGYKQLARIKGSLKIVAPHPEVRALLEMSGLGTMIAIETEASAAPSGESPSASNTPQLIEPIEHKGITADLYVLRSGDSPLTVHAVGGSSPHHPCGGGERVRFSTESLGIGLGAIGSEETQEADSRERLGEFIALGGAIITQPADGTQTTDYLLAQGNLVPEITLMSGLWSPGGFTRLLRFEAPTKAPLSHLVELALKANGGRPVAFAMVAETLHLIGVSLASQPDPEHGIRFEFPQIRDSLLFTAEPAWPRNLSLVVGFATPCAARSPAAMAPLLRPIQADSPEAGSETGPQVHIHAAAFPYGALPKGVLNLQETVSQLLETERALGVLHLIHDWRSPGGAGESLFHRGALWIAPIAS